MTAIVMRLVLVLVALAGLGLVVGRLLSSPPAPPQVAESAAGMAGAMADGSLAGGAADAATASASGNEAQHGTRYAMASAAQVPPLPPGAIDIAWSDLWADGTTVIPTGGERIGTPDRTLFPDGTTETEISDFFLDLDDMRALQPRMGAIRNDLDGKRVRLAGYTTPVGFAELETRFLLVPVLGACIHVPPPPPNQIVYVEQAATAPEMFAAVWVTGTLRASPVATILADVGYRLEDVTTERYE